MLSNTTSHTAHPLPAATHPSPYCLSPWDLAGMLGGFALVLAITVVNSRGRVFWEDEMLGWLLLHDPSWQHMIRAWNLGADGGGFSFYLLGRAWFAVAGPSMLAFRLFSGVCFGLAFAVLWAALRRSYSLGITAFALCNSYFFNLPLTRHFIEGRFYGLLVLSTALAVWLNLRLDAEEHRTQSRWWLLAAFLIHGLLTTSHVLGVVYSAFLVGALVLLDVVRRRWRPALYLACCAAWLLLIAERTSIAAAARVGQPHFWTTAPTAVTVLGAYTGFSNEILLVLCILLGIAAVALLREPGNPFQNLRTAFRARPAAWITGLAVLLIPVGFLLEGLIGTWLFTDRYLQPVVAGIALLTAELVAAGLPLAFSLPAILRRLALAAGGLGYAALLLFWVLHHVAQMTMEPIDYTAQLTAHLPRGVPVVVEDVFTFTNLMAHHADSGVDYLFLLDWNWAISPDAPHSDVTQYHLMQNWQRAGYFPAQIQDAARFFRQHPQFLVVHSDAIHPDPAVKPETGNPFTARLARDPEYTVQPYFVLDRRYKDATRDTVSLACRGTCQGLTAPAKPPYCVLTKQGTQCGPMP